MSKELYDAHDKNLAPKKKTACKENFRIAAILLLSIPQERLNKNSIFFQIYDTNTSNCTPLLLFLVTFVSLLPLYKHLRKLVRRTILLFALEHVVHTFFAINLTKIKSKYMTSHYRRQQPSQSLSWKPEMSQRNSCPCLEFKPDTSVVEIYSGTTLTELSRLYLRSAFPTRSPVTWHHESPNYFLL